MLRLKYRPGVAHIHPFVSAFFTQPSNVPSRLFHMYVIAYRKYRYLRAGRLSFRNTSSFPSNSYCHRFSELILRMTSLLYAPTFHFAKPEDVVPIVWFNRSSFVTTSFHFGGSFSALGAGTMTIFPQAKAISIFLCKRSPEVKLDD
jgi:hypothetical protein